MIGNALNYVVNVFKSDDLVHTVEISDEGLIDVAKENIYPIVVIRVISKTDSDEEYAYVFDVAVLQQRDSDRKMHPSKTMEDTNYIDNLNTCDSIVNKFTNFVRRFDIDSNYTITLSSIQIISGYGGSNLDGLRFELTISEPNTGYCNV